MRRIDRIRRTIQYNDYMFACLCTLLHSGGVTNHIQEQGGPETDLPTARPLFQYGGFHIGRAVDKSYSCARS